MGKEETRCDDVVTRSGKCPVLGEAPFTSVLQIESSLYIAETRKYFLDLKYSPLARPSQKREEARVPSPIPSFVAKPLFSVISPLETAKETRLSEGRRSSGPVRAGRPEAEGAGFPQSLHRPPCLCAEVRG